MVKHILNIQTTTLPLSGIQLDKYPENALKAYLNKTIMRGVTKELLVEMGVFEEIKSWFEKMKELNSIISE